MEKILSLMLFSVQCLKLPLTLITSSVDLPDCLFLLNIRVPHKNMTLEEKGSLQDSRTNFREPKVNLILSFLK